MMGHRVAACLYPPMRLTNQFTSYAGRRVRSFHISTEMQIAQIQTEARPWPREQKGKRNGTICPKARGSFHALASIVAVLSCSAHCAVLDDGCGAGGTKSP